VADDNSNIQKMVSLAFAEQGFEVVAVGNGEAAVRKASEIHPDIVLADIFMPVRNGYEVCEFVKKDSRLSKIPVILLVGAFDPLDEKEAKRVGADGVLKKPFVPPDPLIAMVTSVLEKARPVPARPRVEAKAELPAPPVAAAAPPPPPVPFAEPEVDPQEDFAMFGSGPGVLSLREDQAAEGFSGHFETTTHEADGTEFDPEGDETETEWRRRRAEVDYEAPAGSPDLMDDAVEEKASAPPAAAPTEHTASSSSEFSTEESPEIAAEPTGKTPYAASPAQWLEMMSDAPASEPAAPVHSSGVPASEPVEIAAAPAVESQPAAPPHERVEEAAPSLVAGSPAAENSSAVAEPEAAESDAAESDAHEYVPSWHPGSSALEEVAAAIENAHPSDTPVESVPQAIEEPPQVSQSASTWNAEENEPAPSEEPHSGGEWPAAVSTPALEPPQEERWWQPPPPVFEPATSAAQNAAANPADAAIKETAIDPTPEPELLVAPAARVPTPLPEPEATQEAHTAAPVSSAEGLLPTLAHAEADPLTLYAASEPTAFYPEEALTEETAALEEPAPFVNSFHASSAADPAVVDAVVSRLLEKLEPHLHEIFSQEVLRPLVENMLHHDAVEKKS
jgi:CheY-like chemotaxis protein